MGEFSVRSASIGDLGRIGEVYRLASLSNPGDRDPLLAHPEVLEFDPAALVDDRTVVAVDGAGHVVGFATLAGTGPTVELEDLFVDPEQMRQGVATRLIQTLAARAGAAGATAIEVTANDHAMAFYRSVGFAADGQRETMFGPAQHLLLELDGRADHGPDTSGSS